MLTIEINTRSLIAAEEWSRFIPVRPKPESLLQGDGLSPQATIMPVRKFGLRSNNVVPFHWHPLREKVYYFQGGSFGDGHVDVYQVINGELEEFQLDANNRLLAVNPNTPHALICRETGRLSSECHILVFMPSHNVGDTVWEDGW
jgi:hypothetical protein